jgi:hypothetical protein
MKRENLDSITKFALAILLAAFLLFVLLVFAAFGAFASAQSVKFKPQSRVNGTVTIPWTCPACAKFNLCTQDLHPCWSGFKLTDLTAKKSIATLGTGVYQYTWKPTFKGTHTISLVTYGLDGYGKAAVSAASTETVKGK